MGSLGGDSPSNRGHCGEHTHSCQSNSNQNALASWICKSEKWSECDSETASFYPPCIWGNVPIQLCLDSIDGIWGVFWREVMMGIREGEIASHESSQDLPRLCSSWFLLIAHWQGCTSLSMLFFFLFLLGARQAVFLLSLCGCYLVTHFFFWSRCRMSGLSHSLGFAGDLWNSVNSHPLKSTDALEPRAPRSMVVFIFYFWAHRGKVHLQGCIQGKGLSLRTFIQSRSTASLSAIIKGMSLLSESFTTLNSLPAFVEVFCL